jgi:hypothetical protein
MSGFSISIKKSSGRPFTAGSLQLTPVSQAVVMRAPGRVNRLVWNRPVTIRVQSPGQDAQVLPVYDYTRLVQILILGAGLLGSTLIWLILRNSSNSEKLS